MRKMSTNINRGIEKYGIVNDANFGRIYAYEVDGYGSAVIMDDPNIPSLLSAPAIGYTTLRDPIYANTRRKLLSRQNPYYAVGEIITGIASPHTLPGRPWPMALIMTILTSVDDEEILCEANVITNYTIEPDETIDPRSRSLDDMRFGDRYAAFAVMGTAAVIFQCQRIAAVSQTSEVIDS
ncbi:hypothetical protein CFE70_000655 [Pyrenophora teres f. teres 0-1]